MHWNETSNVFIKELIV